MGITTTPAHKAFGKLGRITTAAASLLVAGGLLFSGGQTANAQTAEQMIQNAPWQERPIAEGVVWKYYFFEGLFNSNQNINVIEIDLDTPGVEINIPYRLPNTSNSAWAPLHNLVTQAPASGHFGAHFPDAIAAINGSYYKLSSGIGGSDTYLRIDGTTLVTEQRDAGNVGMQGGIAIKDSGTTAGVVTQRPAGGWGDTTALDWDDILVGGPNVMIDGAQTDSDGFGAHCTNRHPRTLVGHTADNRLLLVTVDGRQGAQAAGMTCNELAVLMDALGAHDAVNLDGGGSTTMWVASEPGFNNTGVINRFSDPGIRGVSDGVSVTAPPLVTLPDYDARLIDLDVPTLTRSGEDFVVTATYENIGSETWTASDIEVITSRAFGRTSAFVPGPAFFEVTPASVAPNQTATVTLNLISPSVASDTVYTEHFALSHTTEGYFGPADNELGFTVTVRPPLVGAPPTMIIQGTPSGPNSQWYLETVGTWSPSVVAFTAPGVANGMDQRFVWSSTLNREARFAPVFDVPGYYRVEVAFPGSTNNITNVRYQVHHLEGVFTRVINQHPGAGEAANTWIELGVFPFSDAEATRSVGAHYISVMNPNTSSGDRFYSGAARFDFVDFFETSVDEWSLY